MKGFFKQNRKLSSFLIAGSLISSLLVSSCTQDGIDEEIVAANISASQVASVPQTGIIYTIENRNSGRIMEIAGASNADGANLQQSGTDATPRETHRMFEIINTTDDFIRIRGIDSRKSLEVRDGSNSNGANVEQRAFEGLTHQEWELISTGDNYYRIRSRDSRKTIGVQSASRSNGANIIIDRWNGDDRFQWRFLEVTNSVAITMETIVGDAVEEVMEEETIVEIIEEMIEEEITVAEIVEEVMDEEEIQEMIQEIVVEEEGIEEEIEEIIEEVIEEVIEEMMEEEPSIINGVFNLDPNLEPWENFDLTDWAIDTPAERSNDRCRAVRSNETQWNDFRDSSSSDYFFTHTDGGMRFVSIVGGATTNSSCNSGFPRCELRENLRAGNTDVSETGVNANNWALGYQPTNSNIGARNGRLAATLKINQVTTTGDGLHPGRTIIGQIHASDDEPARLYYRKCPGAEFGSIYLEHEINGGDDVTFNLIGSERCDGNGPSDGIRLDELFSYEIINENELITVNIRRGDFDADIIATTTVDMDDLDSGYDERDEWMYFKAGLYTQNRTGDDDDRDVATFYRISNSHD